MGHKAHWGLALGNGAVVGAMGSGCVWGLGSVVWLEWAGVGVCCLCNGHCWAGAGQVAPGVKRVNNVRSTVSTVGSKAGQWGTGPSTGPSQSNVTITR